jgi:hypothetical protein
VYLNIQKSLLHCDDLLVLAQALVPRLPGVLLLLSF